MTATTTTTTTADNGVDVDALMAARAAMAETPEAAAFRWRVAGEWVDGLHVRSTITDFTGAGGEHTHRTPHVIDNDSPEVFRAGDNGPGPTSTALAALAGCMTAVVSLLASTKGIQLRSVDVDVEGDMDYRGTLGIDPEVRNGFSHVRMSYRIDADATDAELRDLLQEATAVSPVFDLFTNPTPVTVGLA